jgi:hypothetical protein
MGATAYIGKQDYLLGKHHRVLKWDGGYAEK